MSKGVIVFLAIVGTLVGLVLVYVVGVPLPVVLSLGFGALCLLWLIVLLTVPWNLYFQAHTLIHEIRMSRERGIEVSAEREAEARRIAVRMRWAAIAAHVVSAGVLAVITYFSGESVGYYFAGFYLLSTFFRPAGAWFSHLRDRMTTMLTEIHYPREDVVALVDRVKRLEERAEVAENGHTALVERHDAFAAEVREERRRTDATIDAMGRRFEDAINRLTDNQEVITGIKAFLRLIRSEAT